MPIISEEFIDRLRRAVSKVERPAADPADCRYEQVPMGVEHVPLAEIVTGSLAAPFVLTWHDGQQPPQQFRTWQATNDCLEPHARAHEMPLPLIGTASSFGAGSGLLKIFWGRRAKPARRDGDIDCGDCHGQGQVALLISLATCTRCGGSGLLRPIAGETSAGQN